MSKMKSQAEKTLEDVHDRSQPYFSIPALLNSADWWLAHGKWNKKGKRAYTQSIALSLLSIATSLDTIAKVINKDKK